MNLKPGKMIQSMSPAAWYINLRTVQLVCVLILAALVFLIGCDGNLYQYYAWYFYAIQLHETGQSVLLLGLLAAIAAQEISDRG